MLIASLNFEWHSLFHFMLNHWKRDEFVKENPLLGRRNTVFDYPRGIFSEEIY